jgi:hypothetical protein
MLNWPHQSGAHFPIPRLSEGFIDDVVAKAGGKRTSSFWTPPQGTQNADYLFPGAIAELKILEEEGLWKESRQDKLAKLLNETELSAELRTKIHDVLMEPIQGAVRKAARQLSDTRKVGPFGNHCTVLIAANSGYSSLPAELFEHLVLRSCRKDTAQIDFLVCLSVHYHQGDFDAYVFFQPKAFPVKDGVTWAGADSFLSCASKKFEEAMTTMMRDQMNPTLWANHLPPVCDIVFEREGITYARQAPPVPDSRFE